MMNLFGSQFLLWRKDPSNLPIREVGEQKISATTMIRSLLLLSPLVVVVAFTTWGVNPELILGLQFVKHHDCQGGIPPWLS